MKNQKELFGEINNKLITGFITVAIGAIILEAIAYYYTIEYGLNTSSIILLSFVLALVISLFAAVFIARPISQPIEQLYKATREIKKGNFKTRVNIKTKDEIETLGDSFNLMAEELEKIEQEHKQIDKAKTRLLSITSHELKSPMTPIKAQLQMLIENYFGSMNKKQKKSLKTILKNTDRLDKIIGDFLDVSRIEAARLKFRYKKTNLEKHIKKAIKDLEEYMPEKKIKIKTDLDNLPELETDPERVVQVLRNLTENAKKFSSKGGEIMIKAKNRKKDILISVNDDGVGISEKNKEKIFKPFYQEEETMYRNYSGSGLGLTICKGIVESQGGKLWVKSEKGKGSEFYFTIPKKPVKESLPIKSILVSEDEEDKEETGLKK